MPGQPNALSGVLWNLSFVYIPEGIDRTAYDGGIKEIRDVMEQLSFFLDKFREVVICSDLRVALYSVEF